MDQLTDKETVEYLIDKGWRPHPKDPTRFWLSPNHSKQHLAYGTAKAYDSQMAFEKGETLKEQQARRSVSRLMFWAVMIGTDGRVTYAKEDGSCDIHRGKATKFSDLKAAVAGANKVLESNPKFDIWGFERVGIR